LVGCCREKEGRKKGRVQIEKMSKEIESRLRESGRVERERGSSFRQYEYLAKNGKVERKRVERKSIS